MRTPAGERRAAPGRRATLAVLAPPAVVGAILVAGCGAAGPPAAPGPAPGPAPAPASPPRVVAVEDSVATAVAIALVFPGSAWELAGMEGLTLLAAETLLEQARTPLAARGARAGVACGGAIFEVTLVAPPESWEAAVDILLGALFRPDPDRAALEAARLRLSRALALDHASPAWQARLAARQALHGGPVPGSAWEAPPCGVPEALDRFDLEHVRAAAYRFAPRMVVAAVIGPIPPPTAIAGVRSWLPAEPPPLLPAPAHTGPGRRYVERNTVTAWTAHAFPFGPDVDEEAVGFLGALLEDAFSPGVARPGVLATTYEVERHGRGGALIVHMVTAPAEAPAYAAAVVDRVDEIARDGVPRAVWDRVARRHRGVRLRERETPEARAVALARALALGTAPGPGDGWPDARAATRERVRLAAAYLGLPARAVVGPRSARPAVVP